MEKCSITSLLSAYGRAYHAENATPPVFADGWAKQWMTEEEYRSIGDYLLSGLDFFCPERKGTFSNREEALSYIVNDAIAPTPVFRAAYAEAALEEWGGIENYVLLGAGLDTFAFRRPSFVKSVFEVDHPLTQKDKRDRIARAGWEIPENLTFVPTDFTKENALSALAAGGLDWSRPTFFSLCGVVYYLKEETLKELFSSLSLSAEGSGLFFDYGDEGLFSSPVRRVQNMLAMARAGGEPMRSCFSRERIKEMLRRCGWEVSEDLGAAEISARFGADGSDGLKPFERIRFLLARRQNGR